MDKQYRLTSCKILNAYKLFIAFEDGSEGVIDIKHLVGKGVFKPLEDVQFFKQVAIDKVTRTICWPGGLDLDPVSLRERLKPLDDV